MSSINGVPSAIDLSVTTQPKPAKGDLVSQDSFLKLLVAQIKHQDPLNPADGTQFLSQLAQFSGLEQLVGIRNELRSSRESAATPTPESIR